MSGPITQNWPKFFSNFFRKIISEARNGLKKTVQMLCTAIWRAWRRVKIHGNTCQNRRNALSLEGFSRFMASELVQKCFFDGFENSKKVLKKGVFSGFSCPSPRGIHGRLDLGNSFSPHQSARMTSELVPSTCQPVPWKLIFRK